MPSVEDSRIFDLPKAEIYALLMDVENFSGYVPYIRSAHVVEKRAAVTIAEVTVGVPSLHFMYRCEITETPTDRILIRELSGPFEYLRCEMLFEALDAKRTRVTYRFSSRFRSRLMNAVADPVFSVQLKSTLRELERFIRRRGRRGRR
jgi:ribosome-associated toxin RatA of RatAB toxin-antitoxin module